MTVPVYAATQARYSDLVTEPTRSRKTFRWMPAPVLSHHLPPPKEALDAAAGVGASVLGRGLYSRKVGPLRPLPEAGAMAAEPARALRTLLRWQQPLRYLILWQRGGFTLTWHAPWCRRCDCPGAGWRFSLDDGYLSGLGFEVSYLRE